MTNLYLVVYLMRKIKNIPSLIWNEIRVPILSIIFHGSTQWICKNEIRNKTDIIKKAVKSFLLTDGMILSLKDPEVSTRKLLEFVNTFSKVVNYKTNILKPIAFLYGHSKLAENETRKNIPFIIDSKIIKYLGLNFIEEVKDLYDKKKKTFKCPRKKPKKALEDEKIFHASGLTELIV